MIAAVYARVSTDAQAEKGYSLPTQLEACRTKALSLGAVEVMEYVDDGYSGASLDRPELERLRQDTRDGIVSLVVVYDPDRMSRNLAHQLILTEEFEKRAQLHFVNFEWQATPEGRLFYSIRGAVSAYEREKIRERSIRGKTGKAKSGRIVFNAKPYGYTWDAEASMYAVNPDEAPVVRRMYELALEGRGLVHITQQLVREGWPPKRSRWNSATVDQVLRNPMYAGTAYANRHKTVRDGKVIHYSMRPQEEWIPIPCPAIIDQETFDKAQAQRQANKNLAKRNTKEDYLLRGLVVCARCGKKMQAIWCKKRRYLRCRLYKHGHGPQGPEARCDARMVPIEALEDVVWERMVAISRHPEVLVREVEAMGDGRQEDIEHLKTRLSGLQQQESRLIKARSRVSQLYSSDLIPEAEAMEQLASIKSDLADIAIETRGLETELATAQGPRQAIDLAAKVQLLFRGLEDASFDIKRAAILSTLSSVEVERIDTTQGRWAEAEIDVNIHYRW